MTVSVLTGCASTDHALIRPHSPSEVSANFGVATAAGPIRLAYPTTGPGDPAQNFGDLYLPPQLSRRSGVPLVVLIHGGGWQKLHGGSRGLAPMAKVLVRKGVAVFNIEYRRIGSGGGWPITLYDARDALAYATRLPSLYPQLARSITVVGHSAGGQLAVWSAHHLTGPLPARVISIAGPLDLAYAATHGDHNVLALLGGGPHRHPDRYAMADPGKITRPKLPILLLQGAGDRVVPDAVAHHYLTDIAAGASWVPTLVEIPGATHSSLVTPGGAGFDTVIDQIVTAVTTPSDPSRPRPALSVP